MAEAMMGLEVEHAPAALGGAEAIPSSVVAETILAAAWEMLPHVRALDEHGMFLPSGGRFYLDYGDHPEWTTPECTNPWDAVRYLEAGDRWLLQLAAAASKALDGAEVVLFAHNVDYSGSDATWGCHESYLHRADPRIFREHLLPHLVSRIVFAGAGGFARPARQSHFTLSPRASFLDCDISGETTHSRGILNTRDEPLCGAGYSRLHLVCGENLRSRRANFLKVGTTALVVALIQGGVAPGGKVAMPNGVSALRRFAADPTCRAKAPCAGGGYSAIEIQRHYLELAERHAQAEFMPAWSGRVCHEWRRMLDRLDQGAPDSVSAELDWGIKHLLFRQHARKQGAEWESFRQMDESAPDELPLPVTDSQSATARCLRLFHLGVGRSGRAAADDGRWPPARRSRSSSPLSPRVRLEQELFELDARFSQLGPKGLFQQLDAAGVLDHHVEGVTDIERAMHHPPASGRAHIRGEVIRRALAHRRRIRADWSRVVDEQDGKVLELDDPFTVQERWVARRESAPSRTESGR